MTIAWVFPGQGSQTVGMGRELYAQVPAARAVFEAAGDALDFSLARLCFEGPEDVLTATEYAQPAILTLSVALLHALHALLPADSELLAPQAVAGHSLGEYSALVAAGSLDLPTALRLVRRRGELMAASREGTMAAVMGLDDQTLDQICRQVSADLGQPVVIANYNAPGQVVISGASMAVACAGERARSQGARRVLPLKVSAAFHSPLMRQAEQGMQAVLVDAPIGAPRVPLLANVTAEPLVDAEQVRHELCQQIGAPVRWAASVQALWAQGVTTFVEIGPDKVLSGLIKRIVPGARLVSICDVDDMYALAGAQALS